MRSGSPRQHRHPESTHRIIDPACEEGHYKGSDVAFYAGSFLVIAALVGVLCTPAYFIGKRFAVDSYTFITDEVELSGTKGAVLMPRRIFVAEGDPLRRMNGSRRRFLVQKGVTTRRHKALDAGHADKEAPATSGHHHVPKDPEAAAHNISFRGDPVQLLCFFGATFDGPWPTKLCSHLVYSGAIMGADDDWLQLDTRPGARRAFSAFLALKDSGDDDGARQSRLVMGIREPPTTLGAADTNESWPLVFAEQGKARDTARRAANWLSNRRIDGLALLGQRLDPGRIDAYATILKEFRTAFSGKLLLLFSIFWLYDMDNKVKSLFLERRIKELIRVVTTFAVVYRERDVERRLTDFTLLETHVPPHKEGECVTFLPNSFSRSHDSNANTFTMNAVLAWMDRAAAQVDRGSVCFTMTLAVMRFLLPLEHTGFGETCQDFYPVSYMQHCRLWENVRFDSSSAANYAEVPGKGGMSYHRLEAYDNVASLDIKLESILSRFSRLCVALVHVDLDDYLGVCGHSQGPFARLASAREVLRRFSVTAQFYVDLKRRRR